MISNGLNKVVLCDLVIVEILPVLEKESKFKKAQGLLVTGFSALPPPLPHQMLHLVKFFFYKNLNKRIALSEKAKREIKN